MRPLLLAVSMAVLGAHGAVGQSCPGDLNGDGHVTVDEIIQMVTSALDGCPQPDNCPGDLDGNGTVTVDEILAAVLSALDNCMDASGLSGLIGTWTFTSDIDGTSVVEHFALTALSTSRGAPALIGINTDTRAPVLAQSVGDDSDLGFAFTLTNPGESVCDLFLFNRTGPDTVEGLDILRAVDAGTCAAPLNGFLDTMTGVRASP
jgi:hypothetical protein